MQASDLLTSTPLWTPATWEKNVRLGQTVLIGRLVHDRVRDDDRGKSIRDIESGRIESITDDFLTLNGAQFARCNFYVADTRSSLKR